MLEAYAPESMKGPETSAAAHRRAQANPIKLKFRDDILQTIENSLVPLSADCLTKDKRFRTRWRKHYRNEDHFLQDIRRYMSELKKLQKIGDSGHRVEGIGGGLVSCLHTRNAGTATDSQRKKRTKALNLAISALEYYGETAAFHTGLHARLALDKIKALIE